MAYFSMVVFIGTVIIASLVIAGHRKSTNTSAALRQSAEYEDENTSIENQKHKSVAGYDDGSPYDEDSQECDCMPLNLCKIYKSTADSVGLIDLR